MKRLPLILSLFLLSVPGSLSIESEALNISRIDVPALLKKIAPEYEIKRPVRSIWNSWLDSDEYFFSYPYEYRTESMTENSSLKEINARISFYKNAERIWPKIPLSSIPSGEAQDATRIIWLPGELLGESSIGSNDKPEGIGEMAAGYKATPGYFQGINGRVLFVRYNVVVRVSASRYSMALHTAKEIDRAILNRDPEIVFGPINNSLKVNIPNTALAESEVVDVTLTPPNNSPIIESLGSAYHGILIRSETEPIRYTYRPNIQQGTDELRFVLRLAGEDIRFATCVLTIYRSEERSKRILYLLKRLGEEERHANVYKFITELLELIDTTDTQVIPKVLEKLQPKYHHSIRREAMRILEKLPPDNRTKPVLMAMVYELSKTNWPDDFADDARLLRQAMGLLSRVGDESALPLLQKIADNKKMNRNLRKLAEECAAKIIERNKKE